jgi:hypothetical protein
MVRFDPIRRPATSRSTARRRLACSDARKGSRSHPQARTRTTTPGRAPTQTTAKPGSGAGTASPADHACDRSPDRARGLGRSPQPTRVQPIAPAERSGHPRWHPPGRSLPGTDRPPARPAHRHAQYNGSAAASRRGSRKPSATARSSPWASFHLGGTGLTNRRASPPRAGSSAARSGEPARAVLHPAGSPRQHPGWVANARASTAGCLASDGPRGHGPPTRPAAHGGNSRQ